MEIETKTASLETFSVTIRALHVNGKQMTLAVFRQLPVENETPDDEKWGIVRYAIKDQGDIWLVFSHEGRLYRRALDPYANVRRDREWIEDYTTRIAECDEDLAKPLDPASLDPYGYGRKMQHDRRERTKKERESWVKSLLHHEAAFKKETARAERDALIVNALPQLFIAV